MLESSSNKSLAGEVGSGGLWPVQRKGVDFVCGRNTYGEQETKLEEQMAVGGYHMKCELLPPRKQKSKVTRVITRKRSKARIIYKYIILALDLF